MAPREKAALQSGNIHSPLGASCSRQPCPLTFSRLSELPDDEVMEHLKGGNQDALAVLFDRYHRLVLSIALRILRDQGEAEDLMQTVFFEIYRAAGQFDALKGTTKAWVLQYTYHRSLNRRHYLNVRSFYDLPAAASTKEREASCRPNGNGTLTAQELARLVEQGLAALTKAQRKTLELAFYEGLTMAEIADRMKESVSNIRHHYYRGIHQLRAVMQLEAPSAEKSAEPRSEIINVRA